jgi:hypothetical protein
METQVTETKGAFEIPEDIKECIHLRKPEGNKTVGIPMLNKPLKVYVKLHVVLHGIIDQIHST